MDIVEKKLKVLYFVAVSKKHRSYQINLII